MNCVILQPSYLPWRGVFEQYHKADLVVFYDDVQYDKHGWRNRNRIKTPNGLRWLSVPVRSKGNVVDVVPINEIQIVAESPWNRKHWRAIQQSYGRAPYFSEYAGLLERAYAAPPELLADFTIDLTLALAAELGLSADKFVRSSSLGCVGSGTERLIRILREVSADHYISGPAARSYIELQRFEEAGISVEFMSYDYLEYDQLYPPYESAVSIIDLLFMKGPEAPRYIW